MSGENDKPNQNDSSAGKAPEGGNLSSFLREKAPTMSRILEEEERRAAALAAGDGSVDADLEFTEDDAEAAEEDPFLIVEEESFDISFDHLGDDGDEENSERALQSDETQEEDRSTASAPAGHADDDSDDEDLGPPLPDLSGPATEAPSGDADMGEVVLGDGETSEAAAVDADPTETVEAASDSDHADVELADETNTPAEDVTNDTPENAEPLNLTELDEGLDIAFDDEAEPEPPEPATIDAMGPEAIELDPTEEGRVEQETDETERGEEEASEIEATAPDDFAAVEQDAPDGIEEGNTEERGAEEDVPDIEMVDIDDVPTDQVEPEAEPESEPVDEFAAWGADDDDDDLGPPLPDLSASDEDETDGAVDVGAVDDGAAGDGSVTAGESNEDDWPDAQDLPEPVMAGSDDITGVADSVELEEEELTLEIEGLEFQPGDIVGEAADDTAPTDEGLPTEQTVLDDPAELEASAPEPELTSAPVSDPALVSDPAPASNPAPGIAEPAKPVSVQEALMAAIELHRIGDLEGAARGYEALVRRFPNSAAGWINLGIVLRRLGRLDAALACLRRGVMLNPNDGAAWSNLGNALRAANYLEDAKRAQLKALSLTPGAAQIHYNMGLVTRDFGELAEADACFRRAELLGYDNPDLAWDQSLTVLLSGNLEKGFEAYEARWNLPETQQRYAGRPRWHGTPEKDKTIVIHAEQGLGDSLQFCRYVPALKSRVGRLIFEVQPQLIDLLKASPLFDGVEIRARNHETVEADMQMPLLSAPNLLPLGENVLPGREPYLSPPTDGPRIGDNGTSPRIGIAWAGKPSHKNDANRSAGLSAFTALFDLLNARFYSLQVGPAQAEIRDLSLGAVIQDLSPAIRNFADTASLLQDLDVVVTVDTSVAHLAGAMGKPVWVMLPFAPDWRWQLHRQDSPWYPSMRLFRQTSPGDWDEVFMRVRAGLDDWTIERDGATGEDET